MFNTGGDLFIPASAADLRGFDQIGPACRPEPLPNTPARRPGILHALQRVLAGSYQDAVVEPISPRQIGISTDT